MSKFFLAAPGKAQGADIANQKLNELLTKFPLLEKELLKRNQGKDYMDLTFKNGSVFMITATVDSTRGQRANGGIIEEFRDHDGTKLSEIVLPLLNVDRRDMQGDVDPTEPNQQQIWISSAGSKSSYAYEQTIQLLIQSIVAPETTFCWGCSYQVPMRHGLLNKQYIDELKISSTYQSDSFAREYLSINQVLVDIKFIELLGNRTTNK